ncbi:MAG: C4-dicarboxylic acid transporter DauA [Deltaproteobacteria bacterium]|nr:C4-dicarboxylic acid transporter DauA [Deltaproteobacteria bacterium]
MLFAAALRRSLAEGYGRETLRADVLAGLVVGIVALPLSMALGIAVGVPPQHGLYTAIVAGIVVALLGGSRLQVTGPTAAFVVILAPIVTKYGLSGLLTAGLLAGLILVAMGFARMGRLIEYIPHPVTTGFTAGIGTVIATLQLRDALGLKVAEMPETYFGKVHALWSARGTMRFAELAVAASTLAILLLLPRVTKRVPAPLVAIVGVTMATTLLHRLMPSFEVATIGSKFKTVIGDTTYLGIPPLPPRPMLPWGPGFGLQQARELLGPAFAIAMLGAIESLLSAVIADGMAGTKHDPDAELVGLGVGNIVAPFFGGIAATGALARTATNVRAGGRTPFAAVTHSVVVLAAILLLAPFVAYVPMAALAGLLLLVAWNMSEVRHFVHTLKVAPKSDVSVLLACYGLTVAFDMVIAVTAGVVMAALLFMRRMAELTHARLIDEEAPAEHRDLPEGVSVYEIAGPLFFGAAQNAMSRLHTVGSKAKVVVLALGRVPVIDATGLVALESALERLAIAKKKVIIAGPLPEPRRVFQKANLSVRHDHVYFCDTFDEAISMGRGLAEASG